VLLVPSRRGVCALLTIVALAACSSEASTSPLTTRPAPTSTAAPTTTAATEAPTTTTTVALPPPAPIAWRPCGGGFDCGRVTVPVDYAQPGGPTLEVAVIRRPADDPERRIGSLLVNPGGPGASGVRRVRRGFTISPEVAARFDIIGFDPRGIGDSTPLTCGSAVAAFRAHDLAPDTRAETDDLAGAARAVADECARTEGPRLGHLGTTEVAHDVEVIRRSLGDAQVSFVGLSYGTMIGLLWAEAYPTSVRALVLDGVVDPAAAGDTTAAVQAAAIDDAMDTIDRACAADPACPVAAAGGVLAAYDELARRLEAGAVTGHGVGPTQLAYAAFSATYGPDRWPLLWEALAQGLAGDLAGVADLAAWFTGLVDYAPFALVTCLDAPHPTGAAAWQAAADATARVSPRFGRTAANELLPCAFWPAATFEPHAVEAPGAPPTLVIGSTGDAATPYDQAVEVARRLGRGALLTVDLEGHIALGDSPCATEAATRYLVDLVTPAPGARC
jgi:pimeloyl-ACP methyl ester carboxylesterase